MAKGCSHCGERSCGDDWHTRTLYKKERNVGDRLKVVLLQIYDFVDLDNLQKSEIKALINNLVDEHIHEEDLHEGD